MGDITLRQALKEYKSIFIASRNFAPKTRVEYLHDIEDLIYFLERLGLKEAKDIGIPQLERYLAELDHRGNAGSTRKRKVISIRSFLWYLYQDQYLRINLAKRLIPPFSEAKTPRYLTKFESERLLLICAGNLRDFALIQLLLQTGIKLSEVARLTMNDVELPSRTSIGSYLHVFGARNGKERVIPLNIKACNSLAVHLRGRNRMSDNALFTNRFNHPLSPREIEKIVSKYLLKAGIRNASVQSLRHTFAIHSLISGVDYKTIQNMMGYSDNQTSSIYLSMLKATARKAGKNPLVVN